MEVNVVNFSKENVGVCHLDPAVFSVRWKPIVLNEVVKWQLAKRRSGTHKAKGISDISGTTAKPHQQKRTGRARQGSLRSPQFRGGAVIFGPVVRSHAYSLNKKVRALALRMALSLKYSSGQLLILDNINASLNKTSDFAKNLSSLRSSSSVLLVGEYDDCTALACRNLPKVNLIKPAGVNVFDLLRHGCVAVSVDAVKCLEARLS